MTDNTGEPKGALLTSPEVNLTKLFDDCPAADPLAVYQALIREWATGYLTAPHPDLGREGAVCPFTAASIRRRAFWVGCVDSPDLMVDDIERTVLGVIQRFSDLPPVAEPEAVLKTALIVFPGVTDYRMISAAQKRLKEKSVAMGLMIGQFYPGCEEPGIRNPDFRPLQSPLPLLAIRRIAGSDLPFLASRVEWMEEYLKRFAPALPVDVRSIIAAKFDTRDTAMPHSHDEADDKALR